MGDVDPILDWSNAVRNLSDFVADTSDWSADSPCPGWTVSDLISHTIDLESMLAADPRPDHVPDWSLLPHITSDFGRFTEIGVDFRRGRSRGQLLDELADTHERARERVQALGADATIAWLRGDTPIVTILGMRTFDIWVHEQDARVAVGRQGNLTGPGSANALRYLEGGLPKIWGKNVGAPAGAVLQVTITEPGLTGSYRIRMYDDGTRAAFVNEGDADVEVSMPWLTFVMLGGGRLVSQELRNSVTIRGDEALGQTLVEVMAVTP